MRIYILSLICFLVILPNKAASEIDTFKINLDEPANLRWREVITAKKEYIQQYTQLFLAALQKYDLPTFFSQVEQGDYFKDSEFSQELAGIAQYSGLNYSVILLVNYMYESFAACTSVAYENESGELLLGHNLDYFFTVPMGHAIVLLEFYKSGQLLYKAQSVAGQIGVFSGLKQEAFSITLNQRSKSPTGNALQRLIPLLEQEIHPVIYNIRRSLDLSNSFQAAISLLSNVVLGSPCYFILSGIQHNEGAVITRNSEDVYNLATLDADNVDGDGWFLVQTNSDRDTPDYQKRDIRRYQAENRVRNIGKGNINGEKLMEDVLSLSPNKNQITILSSTLSAQTGEFIVKMWV